jgi:hypothetical protein
VQYGKMFVGWVFTLIIAGLMSALFFALGAFTPSIPDSRATSQFYAYLVEVSC